MDEEVITWNLKGPKRMKKRRELNALLKNSVKYKSLYKKSAQSDMFNLNYANGNNNRFLKNSNDSSSGNEDYYFAANRSIIKERKRSCFCKIFKMVVVGFLITFSLIVGILLIFSYSKFHELINELKSELQSQNDQNQKNIEDLWRQLNEYDLLFKQSDISKYLMNENVTSKKQVFRSIRSIDVTNRLNSYLIEYLFNRTTGANHTPNFKNSKLTNLISNRKLQETPFNDKNFNNLVDEFFKENDKIADFLCSLSDNQKDGKISWINKRLERDLSKIYEESNEENILNQIENIYLNPLLSELERKCNCPIKLAEIVQKQKPP